jgi:hypothetical protein
MFVSPLLAELNFHSLINKIESSIALAAFVGTLLLIALFISQRRDIERLVAFRERDPSYPGSDLAASEALLDRAESELEEIYAERGEPVTSDEPAVAKTEIHPGGLSSETTSDRPALARHTTEMAALEPHPRWKHTRDRLLQPRWLAAIAVAAALVAGLGVILLEHSTDSDEPAAEATKPNAIDPASITVSVLNGTDSAGLAGKVSSDITPEGYQRGEIANLSGGKFPDTIVYFQPDDAVSKRAARKVANLLGKAPVQPITPEAQKLAGDADVVVVAGDDRAF